MNHPALLCRRARTAATLVAGAVVLSAAPDAGAALLISDTFDSVPNGSGINGRTPEVGNGRTWVAPAGNFLGSSGALTVNTSANGTATIDLGADYLSNNKGVYDLSLQIGQPSGSTSQGWVGVGFAQGNNAGDQFVGNGAAPWLLYRSSGAVIVFAGPANTNALVNATATTGTSHTFRIQLDTTPAAWTLNAFVDATQLDLNGSGAGATYTYATNPVTSRYAGMASGVNGAGVPNATADTFSLAGPVPEPGSAAVALVGAGLLACRRRRRGRHLPA